jgi:hypothetical protein
VDASEITAIEINMPPEYTLPLIAAKEMLPKEEYENYY